jgi:hypothetical protein
MGRGANAPRPMSVPLLAPAAVRVLMLVSGAIGIGASAILRAKRTTVERIDDIQREC